MKVQRMTPARLLEELANFIGLCFHALDEDLKEVSNQTGLSYSTLYRLREGKFSLAIHFGTVQALGLAAGFQLELNKTSARLVLVDA